MHPFYEGILPFIFLCLRTSQFLKEIEDHFNVKQMFEINKKVRYSTCFCKTKDLLIIQIVSFSQILQIVSCEHLDPL